MAAARQTPVNNTKRSFLAKLIRSISESSMRKKSPSASPAASPKNSPKPGTQRRRRFVRVIKNDEQVGEEYVNPHVVRKYEKGFWESKYMRKSASLDEPQRPLPYKVTGTNHSQEGALHGLLGTVHNRVPQRHSTSVSQIVQVQRRRRSD